MSWEKKKSSPSPYRIRTRSPSGDHDRQRDDRDSRGKRRTRHESTSNDAPLPPFSSFSRSFSRNPSPTPKRSDQNDPHSWKGGRRESDHMDHFTNSARVMNSPVRPKQLQKNIQSSSSNRDEEGALRDSLAAMGPQRSRLTSSENLPAAVKVERDGAGHLIYENGEVLDGRYHILGTLGEGTFGKVIKVKDIVMDKLIALKIIKNVAKYREAALVEIDVLKKLGEMDPAGKHCVKMLGWFDYYGHITIGFELLGPSVLDLMKAVDNAPYPLELVRHISYQLCHSVLFLHTNQLTHTDLKLENVLFADPACAWETVKGRSKKKQPTRILRNSDIRLIDFGSATFDHEHHSTLVTTRHYRAPEVILQLGWSHPCDVWSIGCIMFELCRGYTLFQTHDDREQLAMMERVLGQIPYRLTRESRTTYFNQGKLNWNEGTSTGQYVQNQCRPLATVVRSDEPDTRLLYDLMSRMMDYDASTRITLADAVNHAFFEKIPQHQRL